MKSFLSLNSMLHVNKHKKDQILDQHIVSIKNGFLFDTTGHNFLQIQQLLHQIFFENFRSSFRKKTELQEQRYEIQYEK